MIRKTGVHLLLPTLSPHRNALQQPVIQSLDSLHDQSIAHTRLMVHIHIEDEHVPQQTFVDQVLALLTNN